MSKTLDFVTVDSFEDFLLNTPPGKPARVSNIAEWEADRYSGRAEAKHRRCVFPPLSLHCDHEKCGHEQIHDPNSEYGFKVEKEREVEHAHYSCRNCGTENKTYSIMAWPYSPDSLVVNCIKVGEWPLFGPRVPARVVSLIGRDRELFQKGRRAESHGLGIGAYAYYRQVVENQWQALVGEILTVAKRINAGPDVVKALVDAGAMDSLEAAVKSVEGMLPPAILVDGQHNPLRLLNSALGFGLHADNMTDEECLEAAKSIRYVLIDLAERIAQARQDHKELAGSLKALQALQAKKAEARRQRANDEEESADAEPATGGSDELASAVEQDDRK